MDRKNKTGGIGMKAFFLSAGLGTRLRPLTDDLPKPMIMFNKAPLLYHAFDFINSQTPLSHIVVNAHWKSDKMISFLNEQFKPVIKIPVTISDETTELLDSGGGLCKLAPLLSQEKNFWVINGDEFLLPLDQTPFLPELINEHNKSGSWATLLVTENKRVGVDLGGAWADQNNKIQAFSKRPIPDLKGWHYTGVMLCSNEIFKYCQPVLTAENILYDLLTRVILAGHKVSVFSHPVYWVETGHYEHFYLAQEQVEELKNTSPQMYQFLKNRQKSWGA